MMNLNVTPELLILAASVIVALGVIWKFLRFVFKIDRALPTLLLISAQFENNGGSTIKDKVDDLHRNQQVVLKIAEDSKLIADTNAKIVKEMADTSVKDILDLDKYMHENMHLIRNQMQVDTYFRENVKNDLARLETRLDNIMPFINRRRESDTIDSSPTDE